MVRRVIAEFLSVGCALLVTLLGAGILVGATANVFWPIFVLGACVLYWLFRPWMTDILEVKKD